MRSETAHTRDGDRDSLTRLADRRCNARVPAADLSEIVREHSSVKTTCMVRNISETGAMIEVGARDVPERFILTNHVKKVRMVCRIAWRRENLIGVSFVTPPRRLATV